MLRETALRRTVPVVLVIFGLTASCSSSEGNTIAGPGEPESAENTTTSSSVEVDEPEEPSTTTSTPASDSTTSVEPATTSSEPDNEPFDYLEVLLEPADLPGGYVVSTPPGLSTFDGKALRVCDRELMEGELPDSAAHVWYQFPGETLGWPPDGVVWQLLAYAYDRAGADHISTIRTAATGDCVMSTDPVLGAREGAARPVDVATHPDLETAAYLYLPIENADGSGTLVVQLQSGDHGVTLLMVGLAPDLLDLPDVAAPIISAAQAKLADAAG